MKILDKQIKINRHYFLKIQGHNKLLHCIIAKSLNKRK